MDLKSRELWVEYSKAKDAMFAYTDTKKSPWWAVDSNNKKKARLNCIHHLLSMVPYEEVKREKLALPPFKPKQSYMRTPKEDITYVPEIW